MTPSIIDMLTEELREKKSILYGSLRDQNLNFTVSKH